MKKVEANRFGYRPEHLVQQEIRDVYMFPVSKGTHEYVDTAGGRKSMYYSMHDGWCIAWAVYERWVANENNKHTGNQCYHRLFLTRYDAEGLHAQLLMGKLPEESEDEKSNT